MGEAGDFAPEPSHQIFHQSFTRNLAEVAGQEDDLSLTWPSLEYTGCSAAGLDLAVMSWQATIGMYVDLDDSEEERRLNIGFLDFFSLALNAGSAEALDEISADVAAFLALFAGRRVSEAVREQFKESSMTGLLILDRAYIHPALRGRDIGAWAVIQAVSELTIGCGDVLVAAYPTPTERRPGQTEHEGAKLLATHWAKSALEPIRHCPQLVGQVSGSEAFREASAALAAVCDLEITIPINDLA